jgi:hypothetical protein
MHCKLTQDLPEGLHVMLVKRIHIAVYMAANRLAGAGNEQPGCECVHLSICASGRFKCGLFLVFKMCA